ncbi:MAG: class I SAM-dependent methyltransferase [Verrucomicrobiales bacterium]
MTDWEERYRMGDTPWDRGGPHPGLVAELSRVPMSGRVLVPGCGFGYDAEVIAALPEVTEIVALDIADSAVATARERLAGWGKRVRVEREDLFALSQEYREAYDWVWEHTCYCAIDPSARDGYVEAMAEVLKPGGQLFAIFFLTPWDNDEENRTAGPPFGTTREDLNCRFAKRFATVRTWRPLATYDGREGREIIRLLRKA